MQFPITVIALSENPSDRMKEDITSVNSAKAADLDGKAVYEVACTGRNGMMLSYFIDKAKFDIVAVKEEMEITGAQGSGKVTITQTADKVLVNETPKDAEGKDMDVFSLTLPEGASEVVQPGPQPPASGAPAAPAASTGSNLQEAPAAAEDDISSHRVLYQEGVDVTVAKDGQTTTERIAVYGIAGMPFPVGKLEVDSRAKLADTVIDIDDAKGGLLIPNKNSAVPANMGIDENGKTTTSFFTHATNVTWKFAKAGTKFSSDDGVYEVEKAGATVAFTKDGVKLDGIKKQ
jgi:hypothetical protein